MTPISWRVTTALSQTATSSSTTSVLRWEKLWCFFRLWRSFSSSVMPSFTSTVNSVPIPLIERAVIFPPIRSTMFLEIARPSPVPPKRAVVPVDSCEKGS